MAQHGCLHGSGGLRDHSVPFYGAQSLWCPTERGRKRGSGAGPSLRAMGLQVGGQADPVHPGHGVLGSTAVPGDPTRTLGLGFEGSRNQDAVCAPRSSPTITRVNCSPLSPLPAASQKGQPCSRSLPGSRHPGRQVRLLSERTGRKVAAPTPHSPQPQLEAARNLGNLEDSPRPARAADAFANPAEF